MLRQPGRTGKTPPLHEGRAPRSRRTGPGLLGSDRGIRRAGNAARQEPRPGFRARWR